MKITTTDAETIRAAIPLARNAYRELNRELLKAIEESGLLAVTNDVTVRRYREREIDGIELLTIISKNLF